MNFRETAAVTRRNPGAAVRRAEDGRFAMYANGRWTTTPPEGMPSAAMTNARLMRVAQMAESLARRLEMNTAELAQLRQEVHRLKETAAEIPELSA